MILITIILTVLLAYSSEIPTETGNSNKELHQRYQREVFRGMIPPRLKARCEELSVTEKFPIKDCEDYDMVVNVLKKARRGPGYPENNDEMIQGPLPPVRYLEDLSKEKMFFESQIRREIETDSSKYREEFFDKVNQGSENVYEPGSKVPPPKRRLNNDNHYNFDNSQDEDRKKYEEMVESFKAKHKI